MQINILQFIILINLFIISACTTSQTQKEVKINEESVVAESKEPTLTHVTNFIIDTSKSLKDIDLILSHSIDTAYKVGYHTPAEDTIYPEDIFSNNLHSTLKSPKTFAYNFPLLTNTETEFHIDLTVSDDGLLRIFDWLSPTSGTWLNFPAIFQAKNRVNKILVSFPQKEVKSEGYIASIQYEKIVRLNSSKKQLYMCFGRGRYLTRAPFESAEIFEVRNDSIVPAKLFDGNSIIQIFTECEYEEKPQEIPDMVFDSHSQTLVIPKITEEEDPTDMEISTWTGKLIKMKFNGAKFVKVE